jgi:hypothetical protein
MTAKFVSALISIKTLIFKQVFILLCMSLIGTVSNGATAASIELVLRETTGYGDSENAAVANALVEALRQVNGISVDSEKTLRTSLRQSETKVSLRVLVEDNIRSTSKGQIESYEVLALDDVAGRWVARLRVSVPQYRGLGLDRSNLRAVAVLPFRLEARIGVDVCRKFEQKLVDHFVQSRRFRILDRDFSAELNQEESRLRSGSTPVSEIVKIGQSIGADYVVVGEISEFEIAAKSAAQSAQEVGMAIHYRVIELAPREVRWANSTSVRFSKEALRRIGVEEGGLRTEEHLLNSLADSVVTEILDAIYPIKVLQVRNDGIVVLNQGGNRVHVGQWFSICQGGEEAIDPDTGLSTRLDGFELALGVVTKVQEKFSEVKVEQSAIESLGVGMPCRRLSSERLLDMARENLRERLETQAQLIREGKSPPLILRPFRTAVGWNFIVKNSSQKAIKITSLTKRIANSVDETAFSLVLRSGGEESFGLPYPFATGDSLEIRCDGYEVAYLVIIP